MTRWEILDAASEAVSRNAQYGGAEDCFGVVADLWKAYLNAKNRFNSDIAVLAEDVPVMMDLLKVGRIACGVPNIDNWVDIAGYAACGGEIQTNSLKG